MHTLSYFRFKTTAAHLALKIADFVASADKADTVNAQAALTAIKADIDALGAFGD